MLANKDRQLTRKTRRLSTCLENFSNLSKAAAADLASRGEVFNAWTSKLTDEGIIGGAEALERDLEDITDVAFEVQKNAADTISSASEIRQMLRRLKTRRINREKQNAWETWERLHIEEAGNAQA